MGETITMSREAAGDFGIDDELPALNEQFFAGDRVVVRAQILEDSGWRETARSFRGEVIDDSSVVETYRVPGAIYVLPDELQYPGQPFATRAPRTVTGRPLTQEANDIKLMYRYVVTHESEEAQAA